MVHALERAREHLRPEGVLVLLQPHQWKRPFIAVTSGREREPVTALVNPVFQPLINAAMAAIQTVIDAADRHECYRWSLFFRQPLTNWSSQRATLLGDAAHATLPYLAQGAAMAIEDGAVLARALAMSPTVPEALQLYQRNRMDRTARIVNQSNFNRDLFHLRSQAEIRAAFAKRNEGGDRNDWLYSYNPLTVPLR